MIYEVFILNRRNSTLEYLSDVTAFEAATFGFADEGVSDKSVHGGIVWHPMRITF